MDRDKLNKAAIIAAANYDNPFDEPAYDKKFYDGFIASADWLIQQPLSERLTDEEKEKILEIHTTNAAIITESNDKVLNAYSTGVMTAIERIFKDLFKDK